MKQNSLAKENPLEKKLAINYYQISAIDSTVSFNAVDNLAKGHVSLTTKYLSQLTAHELDAKQTYGIHLQEDVSFELLETFQLDYVNLENFHASADLLCDGQSIPLRYVVKDSIIDRYLLQNTSKKFDVKSYDEEFIKHHCKASFIEVYLLVGKYLLFLALIAGHIFVTRKALLIFKPEWGGKPVVQFEQSQL